MKLLEALANACSCQSAALYRPQQLEAEPHLENRANKNERSHQHIFQHMHKLYACYNWCTAQFLPIAIPLSCALAWLDSSPSHIVMNMWALLYLSPLSNIQFALCWIIAISIQTFFSIFHLKKHSLGLTSPIALLRDSLFQQSSF